MVEIKWSRDGRDVFEKVVFAVPEPMRESMKPKLLKMLADRVKDQLVDGGVVREWVSRDLPEPQRGVIMTALGEDRSEETAHESQAIPVDAEWAGNAAEMFERMLGEVPEAIRETFRGKLLEVALEKAGGDAIEEAHIVEIVNEKVPDPFKTNILKAYATMGGVDLSKVKEILENIPGGEEMTISILHSVQEEFGYVPDTALVLISQTKGLPLANLYRMVTSYQAFSLEQPKEHNITVCTCTGCHVKGGGKILRELEEKISNGVAGISLQKARGFGCCNISPAVMIDGHVYSKEQALDRIDEILSA